MDEKIEVLVETELSYEEREKRIDALCKDLMKYSTTCVVIYEIAKPTPTEGNPDDKTYSGTMWRTGDRVRQLGLATLIQHEISRFVHDDIT